MIASKGHRPCVSPPLRQWGVQGRGAGGVHHEGKLRAMRMLSTTLCTCHGHALHLPPAAGADGAEGMSRIGFQPFSFGPRSGCRWFPCLELCAPRVVCALSRACIADGVAGDACERGGCRHRAHAMCAQWAPSECTVASGVAASGEGRRHGRPLPPQPPPSAADCVGQSLAMLELRTVLATLLGRLRCVCVCAARACV